MKGIPGVPTRYRLRVKQRLAVVEYVRQHGSQASQSAIWVSEADCSAVVAQLATRRHPGVGASVPRAAAADWR
jgi:hypothetical protein